MVGNRCKPCKLKTSELNFSVNRKKDRTIPTIAGVQLAATIGPKLEKSIFSVYQKIK